MKFLILTVFLAITCKSVDTISEDSSTKNLEGIRASTESYDKLLINGPIDHLIYHRKHNVYSPEKHKFRGEYMDSEFVFNENEKLKGKIRLRGAMRYCDSFPHFKIKFNKGNKLYGQSEFKIVTNGYYKIDSKRKIMAPYCDDALGSDNPEEAYFFEFKLYSLASLLVEYHFKTIPLLLSYKDSDLKKVISSKFGYLLEDHSSLAQRYQAELKRFDPIHEPWGWDTAESDDLFDVALDNAAHKALSMMYIDFTEKNPKLSKKEITKLLPKMNKDFRNKHIKDAKVASKYLIGNIERDQKAFLKNFDKKSLSQVILFNILIRNADWAIFGVNFAHRSGYRNLKFIENSRNKIVAVPYDFDFTKLNRDDGNAIRKFHYLGSFQAFLDHLRDEFDGFLVEELKQEMILFNGKLDEILATNKLKKIGFTDNNIESFTNFRDALGGFQDRPNHIYMPPEANIPLH